VKCVRLWNYQVVGQTISAVWDEISEDNAPPYMPDLINEIYVGLFVDDEYIGMYRFHQHTSVMWEGHVFMLPDHRKHSIAGGFAIQKWIIENLPGIQKMIVYVPECFTNVIAFVEQIGLKKQGYNAGSHTNTGVVGLDQMPTAVAIVGSSIIGGIASSKAASSQAKGQRRAIEANRELVGPFTEFGKANLPALQEFVDSGVDFSDTQAFKDIVNTQKARGQNLSGNTLTELSRYHATNFRPQRFNELFSLARLGANAAVGQASNEGTAHGNIGNAEAAGTLGIANSINSGIQGLSFMNLLNKQSGVQSGVNNLLNQPGMF